MSSTYRLLCLSHDPAIEAHPLSDGWHTRAEAEQAAVDVVPNHEGCDILIMRYSGDLVEVGCPNRPGHAGSYHPHIVVWADVTLIRFLALAQRAPEGTPERQLADRPPLPGCWKPERLHRIRHELHLPEPKPQPRSVGAQNEHDFHAVARSCGPIPGFGS
jgi:hypothetical protein